VAQHGELVIHVGTGDLTHAGIPQKPIEISAAFNNFITMTDEITFSVERDPENGWFSASWDGPEGGGISTEGHAFADLESNVIEAVRCHFDATEMPQSIRLHFVQDPVLTPA
jgi:hypothetical protein